MDNIAVFNLQQEEHLFGITHQVKGRRARHAGVVCQLTQGQAEIFPTPHIIAPEQRDKNIGNIIPLGFEDRRFFAILGKIAIHELFDKRILAVGEEAIDKHGPFDERPGQTQQVR